MSLNRCPICYAKYGTMHQPDCTRTPKMPFLSGENQVSECHGRTIDGTACMRCAKCDREVSRLPLIPQPMVQNIHDWFEPVDGHTITDVEKKYFLYGHRDYFKKSPNWGEVKPVSSTPGGWRLGDDVDHVYHCNRPATDKEIRHYSAGNWKYFDQHDEWTRVECDAVDEVWITSDRQVFTDRDSAKSREREIQVTAWAEKNILSMGEDRDEIIALAVGEHVSLTAALNPKIKKGIITYDKK